MSSCSASFLRRLTVAGSVPRGEPRDARGNAPCPGLGFCQCRAGIGRAPCGRPCPCWPSPTRCPPWPTSPSRPGRAARRAAARTVEVCGRTDYHVAPEDMLRLGLAVCLPSPLKYFSVSLRSNLQKPITSGLDPHVTIGPSIFCVPSLHVHACGARVCLWATAAYGSCAGRTGRDTSEPPACGP